MITTKAGKLISLLFAIALIYSLWTASVGWNTPINRQYNFVQAKAAISTFYIAKGGSILSYELPVLGPPWSVPYEFPFYQVITAATTKLSGMPLILAARLIAKLFFYLSCIPILIIARSLGFRGIAALLPIILFLASPIYLFWSRQVMIESTATFFSLSYLAATMHWWRNSSNKNYLFVILLGVAAALAKSTTYAGFAITIGIYILVVETKEISHPRKRIIQELCLLLLPLLAGLWWVHFTDVAKDKNPLAGQFTSAALGNWYLLSEMGERFQGALWYRFFRVTIPDAIGHRAAWIMSVLFASYLGKRAKLYWICSGLFLLAPLLFTHAHMLHDYYANANAIFMVFGVASLIQVALASNRRSNQIAGLVFLVIVFSYEIREFMSRGIIMQQELWSEPKDFGARLQKIIAPNDVMLIYGEDWGPIIPFYAERRAIMLSNGNWYNPKLLESFRILHEEGKKIGAVLLCHEARTDAKLINSLHLGALMLRDQCDTYQNKNL